MTKYRKLPVTIDAIQWNVFDSASEPADKNDAYDLIDWVEQFTSEQPLEYDEYSAGPSHPETGEDWGQLRVITLEGDHVATPGDFLIRGVDGEFYFCKPDIFAKTYELAENKDTK